MGRDRTQRNRTQRDRSSAPAQPLRIPARRTWIDITVVLVLSVFGVVGFEPPFGGYGFLLAGLGGLALGAAVGILASMYRLNAIATTLSAVLIYFLLGSAIAVPGQAIGFVLPSLASLGSLAIGAVYGWADIVTLQTPIGAPQYIQVVPYVATFVVALVATTLSTRWLPGRPRVAWRHGVMLIGPGLLYLAGILTGTDSPYQAGIRGVSFAVVSLVWVAWRRPTADAASAASALRVRNRKITGTAILVIGAVLIGGGAAFVLAPSKDERFVLREEIDPPFDPLQFASPLSGFREYSKLRRDDVLFSVGGLEPGDVVRLATMDSFNGKLWNVTGPETETDGSGSFALVGRELARQDFITPAPRYDVTVTIVGYDDVWVPSLGYPTELDFTGGPATEQTDSLRYNASTGTAVLTTGLVEGDSYQLDTQVQRVLPADTLDPISVAAITQPPIVDNPDVTTSKAQEYAGGAVTPAAQLEAIRVNLAEQGFLSHGLASDTAPSRAGHGADRINDLLSGNQMIGDEEQYASAFALMATTYGYPARVVMGFAPDIIAGEQTEVLGSDVTAWVEVAFAGVGWVAYNATPDETDIPQDQTPQPQIDPQPQVRQPPRAESEPEDLLTPVELETDDEDGDLPFALPAWVMVLALSLLVPLAIVFLPILVVATVKSRRFRRRRGAATRDRQVAGAWEELTDRFSELGFGVPPRSTRLMVAAALEKQSPAQLREFAAQTDAAVFSGADVDVARSDQAWTEALAATAVARAAATRWHRIASRYRLRRGSLRPSHSNQKRHLEGQT